MAVSLVKLSEWHRQRIFVFIFGLLVIPTVKCTCNPTLIFTGVPKEEELLPITDMATRRSLTFSIKTCGFVVLSLSNTSVLAGSVSRRITIFSDTSGAGIWECKNQLDCARLGYANPYLTCNSTTFYFLYWNKTSLALHGISWIYHWTFPIVTYTWATDLDISYIVKPAGSDYFQGYFEAPFAERCCPPNSNITDSKICTSEVHMTSTTAATTSSSAAATMKLEMTTESADTMSMTTDTTKLTTNVVSTDSIANSTSARKSTVAVEVTSVAAVSDVNETDDRAASATSSSASPATAEGQEVTEGSSPDPSTTVARARSSSPSTPLTLGETTTPGSDTSGLPVKQRLLCACRCLAKSPRIFGNLNSLEANLTEEIKDTLILSKKQLSAQIRAKTSAPDARPSSVSAGIVAVGIISLTFFCLVAPDLLTLVQFIHGVLKGDRRQTAV